MEKRIAVIIAEYRPYTTEKFSEFARLTYNAKIAAF